MERNGTNNYKHILKYIGVFGGAQGLSILIGLVRNKLVAVILGPSGVGIISLYNSTIKLLSDSSSMGLSMSATQRISEVYDNGQREQTERCISIIRSWSIVTALLGMVLCIAFSPVINHWSFGSEDHTLYIILLAPVIGLLALTGGEISILKGTKHLKQLASISIYNVITAVILSVPILYIWRETGIVPSLIIVGVAQMLLTIIYSYRLYPLKISLKQSILTDGMGMIRVGIPFLLAGIIGSGAEFAIRSFLSKADSFHAVGLYNAGYMLTMTYAGMIFSAMETDYFPRLSANNKGIMQQNRIVNQQIEVTLLVLSPMLVVFLVFMPVIIPLLYSGKFLPVLGMMQITVIAMYMRAMMLPIAYLPLSKGDSKVYLLMETLYYAIMMPLVMILYTHYELIGAGIGLTLSGVIELVMQVIIMRFKYHYRMSRSVLIFGLIQILLGIGTYCITLLLHNYEYWVFGGVMIVINCAILIYVLRAKTDLWQSLSNRFLKKKA